jgi:hypothetical protein
MRTQNVTRGTSAKITNVPMDSRFLSPPIWTIVSGGNGSIGASEYSVLALVRSEDDSKVDSLQLLTAIFGRSSILRLRLRSGG